MSSSNREQQIQQAEEILGVDVYDEVESAQSLVVRTQLAVQSLSLANVQSQSILRLFS